jgi:putative FmdB family regulatory protein
MPVYEYTCAQCGLDFERDLPTGARLEEVSCPNGHRPVRRRYSSPAVIFKGSGWYSTDHRKVSSSGSE